MFVIDAVNVNDALSRGLSMLKSLGIRRNSRNGEVIVAPTPVTTVYENPMNCVLFSAQRDANPFFHLYEALWMLAGRRDVEPLARYVPRMRSFSDDHVNLHGAYGDRWRVSLGQDQIGVVIYRLKRNPDDRRCVIQMWSPGKDLGREGVDVPCNISATVQVNERGSVDLTVFCRSNDAIWGAHGANAVHFAMLLEYIAGQIDRPVGRLYQVSVNYHAYTNVFNEVYPSKSENLYQSIARHYYLPNKDMTVAHFNELTLRIDSGMTLVHPPETPWHGVVYSVLRAHSLYKMHSPPDNFKHALAVLDQAPQDADWVIAAHQWISRRQAKWMSR